MNIAFFLIPKNEVIYLLQNCTMRQALEKMEYHRYGALPVLDEKGKFVGTLTDGDLLWKMKNTPELTFAGTERVMIKDIDWRIHHNVIHIDAQMESLLSLAITQNFIPVVDDNENFIGIIRRQEIIEYCAQLMQQIACSSAIA